MPPRTPLGPITPNTIRKRTELSPRKRGQILGMRDAGTPVSRIARVLNTPQTTIFTTLRRHEQRPHGKSMPRAGRPKVLDLRDQRTILRIIRLDPRITYRRLIEQSGVTCSQRTVQRMLKEHGIKNWVAKKHSLLTEEHAAIRLTWALKRKDWTKEEWSKYI